MLFLGVIALPAVVGWVQADVAVSAAEKRLLSPLPPRPEGWAALRAWPRRFEAYYNDHFGFRAPLARAYSWLRYRLGDSPSRQVVRGSDGWFYLNGKVHGDPVGDYRNRNRFNARQLAAFVRGLKVKRDWLAARGIAYLFVVAPNKHTIYPEHLPKYLTRLAPTSALDQLAEAVGAEPGISFLDLRPTLQAARRPGPPVYHRTDSHWNAWGANAAQFALVEALRDAARMPVEPRRWPAESFVWRRRPGGDLALLMGLQRVLREDVPETAFPSCAAERRPLSRDPRTWETVCGGGSGTALIFRDSFFDALEPYFSTYFDRVVYVDKRVEPALLRALVARHRPQVVVEEWVERLLPMVPSMSGLSAR